MQSSAGQSDAAEVLKEHEQLRDLFARVEGCLDRPLSDCAAWVMDLMALLRNMRGICARHFALEERSLYETVPVEFPRYARQFDVLRGQHADLLAELDLVLEHGAALRPGEIGRYACRELNARVQIFLSRLGRHEGEETSLLTEAYLTDLGGG